MKMLAYQPVRRMMEKFVNIWGKSMRKITNIASVLLPVMLLIAISICTSIKGDADDRSSDVHLEVATGTPAVVRDVPSNYVTHTDSTGLFSVSYPLDWKENPYPRGVDLLSTDYLIERVDAGDPIDQAGPVFF